MTKWFCCSKCKKVETYEVHGDGQSSFDPYYYSHLDNVTTGFDTRAEAEEWLKNEISGRYPKM